MKQNKKTMTFAGIALLISVISIGIAFAAMSTTLQIQGTAQLDPATWDIRFVNGSLSQDTTGGATASTPLLNATTIGSYSVVLTKPGDSVTFTFDVENAGTIDAIIAALSMNPPTCQGNGATGSADAAMVCDNLVYTLTNNTVNGTGVAIGDLLDMAGGSTSRRTMVLRIEYPMTMNTIPSDDVTITIPPLTITYQQR
jgi:hypothetical protein